MVLRSGTLHLRERWLTAFLWTKRARDLDKLQGARIGDSRGILSASERLDCLSSIERSNAKTNSTEPTATPILCYRLKNQS